MVLQLDNVDGTENFQPAWASHVPVIRRYTPAIERWRTEVEANMPETLRRRSDAAQLVDKYLWTMSGENAAGDPTLFHDGGNGYGLMADRVSRTPPGSPPDVQIRNAWQLVQNNPKTWTDWGEGSSYQGKPFGALGVIAAYDPSPDAVHPLQGGTSSIRPPNVGEGDLAGATYQPPGWEPPVGYASSAGVPLVEKLRTAREKRLRDTGYIPPEDSSSVAGSLSGSVLSTGKVSPDAYEILQERKKQAEAASAVVEKFANTRSLADIGLGAASNVFSSAVSKLGDLGIDVPNPPMLGAPGSTHRATVGAAAEQAVTPIEPLEAVQDVAGKAGRVAGTFAEYSPAFAAPAFALKKLTGISGGDVGEELGKGLVPTTPAELGLAAITGDFEDAAKLATTAGTKLYDEAAVRLAANETFDRLAPASLLRHERAGAAIAQEAAGIPVNPRSPFARRPGAGGFPIEEWVDENGVAHLGRAPGAGAANAEARRGGAAAGRDFGPEVAGGGAGRKAYGNKVREGYVATLGEDEAVRWEAKLKEQGLDWADYGDFTQPFKQATAAHAVDPGSASVNTRFRGDPNNPADVTSEIRRSVADVRSARAGTDARAQMEAAAARRGGARTGREAGPEVGGGRAGFTPGRPADAQSDEAWAGRVANAKSQALQAAKHRFWYDNSSKGILAMAHGDVADADLITRIAAVGSNQITVPQQGRTILQGWQQWKAGEQVTGAANMRTVSDRVDKALRMSPEEWDNYVIGAIKKGDNQKVTNFWLDMMDDIDPVRAARVREASGATATVDMWMLRAFGYANDQSPTAAQYRTIAGALTDIGKDLGWTPKQVQAAVWVQQIVDSGKPITDAATDYGTAVAAHQAHLRNEILPTPSNPRYENVGMALHRAPPEAVAEYAKSVDEAFRDEQGADILARLLGLPVEPVHGNPLVSGTISKGPARGLANPAQADIVDAYASARAAALGQDEVQWYRPFDLKSAGFHNGVRFDVGRDVTYDDVVALRNELADLDLMYVPGGTQLSVIRPLSEADWAARQANSEAVPAAVTEANKAFRKRVADAAEGYFGGVSAHGQAGTMETFATDGRRFALDGHSLSTSTLGRPDVRAAVDTIAERVSAADDVFAAAYTPGLNAASAEPSAASARLTGARRGREAGSEVAGGSALPPGERPKTQWTITPKEGPSYQVETKAGPVSGSVEEAQARFARNTADQAALNTRNAVDRRVGAAAQAQEGVAALRAGQDPRFDYSKMTPPTGPIRNNDAVWVDPQGKVWQANSSSFEHSDLLKGFTPDVREGRADAVIGVIDDGWTRVVSHEGMLEVEASDAAAAARAVEAVAEPMSRARRAQTDVLVDITGNARTHHEPLDSYLASGGSGAARRAGARQGRMFGGDVGGGSGLIDPNTGRPYDSRRPSIINPETDRAFGSQARPRIIDPATGKPYAPVQGPAPAPPPAPGATPPPISRGTGPTVPLVSSGGSLPPAATPITAAPAQHWGPLQHLIDQFNATKAAVTDPTANRNIMHNIASLPGTAQGLISSLDWGNILRQNQALGWRDREGWMDAAKATIGAMKDPKVAEAAQKAMEASPVWGLATGATRQDRADALQQLLYQQGHGISASLQNVGKGREGAGLFMYGGDQAHAVAGREALNNTVVGRFAKSLKYMEASERAYATGLNVQGMKTIEDLFKPLIAAGEDNLKVYEDLMHVTNLARGRSGVELANTLGRTGFLFSPQFLFSRPQLLNAMRDGTLSPEARRLAREAVVGMAAGQASLLTLLGVTGAATGLWSVNANPLSSDFGALKIGNTRIDALAGYNPLIKTTARVLIKATDAAGLTDEGGDIMAFEDSIRSFLENKAAPIPRVIEQGIWHKQWPDPKDWTTYANLIAPMIAMSIYDSISGNSVKDALLAGPTTAVGELFGGGSNTYTNASDVADTAAQEKYGRGYDDLTRDERLAVIGQVPEERAAKALAKVDRASFESDRNKAGYQDYWDTERKQEFYRSNPDLETQAWYHDRRTLQNVETVDKVLAMGIPNREVRFSGVPVDIARDEKTRAAWDASKSMIEEYSHTIVEKNREAVAQRMYKKDWKALTDSQRSSVVGNIHDLLLSSDPEMKAWMYWWGKTKSIKGAAAVDRVQALQRQYGPGADTQDIGGTVGKHLDVNYKGAPLGAAAR